MLRLMQRLGKPFSVYSGELLQVAENLLLAIPDDSIPIYCLPHFHGRYARSAEFAAAKPRTCNPWSEPPKAGQRIVQDYGYNIRLRGSQNTHPLMVTEGTLAIARETRGVFREDKCCSNKSTYHFGFFGRGIASQLFLRSIFRLITISLRLSREETLRAGDFAPSNSA